jgi:hypothetical protein
LLAEALEVTVAAADLWAAGVARVVTERELYPSAHLLLSLLVLAERSFLVPLQQAVATQCSLQSPQQAVEQRVVRTTRLKTVLVSLAARVVVVQTMVRTLPPQEAQETHHQLHQSKVLQAVKEPADRQQVLAVVQVLTAPRTAARLAARVEQEHHPQLQVRQLLVQVAAEVRVAAQVLQAQVVEAQVVQMALEHLQL